MFKTRIIVDCDPGIDDAIALLASFVSPELEILAITTVSGNQPLETSTQNALKLCELGERTDIPVYAGSHRPLLREPIRGQYHGTTGLGSCNLPEPTKTPEPAGAVEFLIERLLLAAQEEQPITLCALGPLTNIAMALKIEPSIARGIKQLVMMGGAYREPGNRTLTAEFNILADPHAAHIVFSSELKIVALPLDATHQVILTPDHVARFSAVSGRISKAVSELMMSWDRNQVERYGSRGGPLHDPLVIGWLLAPEHFETKSARVFVEYQSELCMGQTVADWFYKTGLEQNCQIVTQVNSASIIDVFLERFSRYQTVAAP